MNDFKMRISFKSDRFHRLDDSNRTHPVLEFIICASHQLLISDLGTQYMREGPYAVELSEMRVTYIHASLFLKRTLFYTSEGCSKSQSTQFRTRARRVSIEELSDIRPDFLHKLQSLSCVSRGKRASPY